MAWKSFEEFKADEEGGVSVDVVGIIGAVITLGIASANVVKDGLENSSADIETHLSAIQISTGFDGLSGGDDGDGGGGGNNNDDDGDDSDGGDGGGDGDGDDDDSGDDSLAKTRRRRR